MAAKKKAQQRKKSGNFICALVLVVLLLVCGVQLLRMRERIQGAQDEVAALHVQISEQKQANAALEAALERADDPKYLQELARDQLNMVSPGQKDFYDISK